MNEKPIRVQRKRVKGYKMPPNTVYVGRPGLYGNMYVVGKTIAECDFIKNKLYEDGKGELFNLGGFTLRQPYTANYMDDQGYTDDTVVTAEIAVALYREQWRNYIMYDEIENSGNLLPNLQDKLRGKNLACFCPLGQPCHADVLLELVNG